MVKKEKEHWLDKVNRNLEAMTDDVNSWSTGLKTWAANRHAQKIRSEDSFWHKINPKNWFRKKK